MLDRGFTIFRIRGIPVRLHFTLILFLPYIAFASSTQFTALAAAFALDPSRMHVPPMVWGVILAVGLFVSILIHEFSHSLVALRHGVPVRSITLMMLGGISAMERDDDDHEAWMAFAGPLASIVLALVAFAAYRFLPLPAEVGIAMLVFALTNAVLGVFNLLPAFPMDGGRILRGLLTKPLGRDRATRIATVIGRALAIALGVVGFMGRNFFLPLIAIFVYLGAAAEDQRRSAREPERDPERRDDP